MYPYDNNTNNTVLAQPFQPTMDYASMYKATAGLRPWQGGPTVGSGSVPNFNPTAGTPQIDFYKMLNALHGAVQKVPQGIDFGGIIQNLVQRRATETNNPNWS